ncbi:MAG: Ni/Fe hydrogenase subunit alpha [Candidatus Parcubacteria bacterium]|nr:Ni/Fe hydrogenase subunit alpha [Candidatus Parcubacteria bacterium]
MAITNFAVMKIKIKKLARIEGHAGFEGHLFGGEIKKAKIEVKEGARLIEGLLVGRHFSDAPIITARICGICPVVHSLTAIKAIEDAFNINVRPEVTSLRKLMLWAQFIHSHTLHLFFLSFPDFLNYSDDLAILKRYSHEAELAMLIRKFGTSVIEVIGGRTVHPITAEVGGFKKYPSAPDLKKLLAQSKEALSSAVQLVNFFKKLNYPEFHRPTTYISLSAKNEYGLYDGQMKMQNAGQRPPKILLQTSEKMLRQIVEAPQTGEIVKRTHYQNQVYLVGALARINNNAKKLNPRAKAVLGAWLKKRPIDNSFYNILAQAVEVVHCVEECQKALRQLTKVNWQKIKNAPVRPRTGRGLGVSEAPRGTLYHYYEIDASGIITKCNIITPTAQFLSNLEEDLRVWLPKVAHLSSKERERKIKMLIRAYDPCITCATH